MGGKQWDADKVRRVLEGKAVVRVVDVESPKSPVVVSPPVPAAAVASASSSASAKVGGEKCAMKACVTDILEESMRSLSLGKK
jgi:hypothetical protein